jgi:CelD/BcsL family acetyltransferase involved in cellulose biosynthesis
MLAFTFLPFMPHREVSASDAKAGFQPMSSAMALTVEALKADAAAAHQAEWQNLADRAIEPNVFLAPGFALAAARHLTKHAPTFLFVWDERTPPRRLVGLCPIAEPHGLDALLPRRLWIHEQAPLGTPLLDTHCAADALAAIFTYGRQHLPAGLLFPMLPQDGPVAKLLTAAAASDGRATHAFGVHQRAMLSAGHDPQNYAQQVLTSHRRRNLKRTRRLLEAQGPLTVEIARESLELKAATAAFLALESQGWKGRRGTAFLVTPARTAFVQESLDALAARGAYFAVSLVLAGKPIAIGLVLRSGDRAFWWKVAYDEAYATHSPGVHLSLELTSVLLKDHGIALTDSCAKADHPMIDHLWPERLAIGDVFVAFSAKDAKKFAALARRETLYRSLRGQLKEGVIALRRLKDKSRRAAN